MPDVELRRLARQAALGEPGARAALLRERVRVGELSPARLALAAYLGDEDAGLASDEPARAPAPAPLDGTASKHRRRALRAYARTWCAGLGAHAHDALVRAALAAARCVEGELDPGRDCAAAREALDLVEAWLASPEPRPDVEQCTAAGDRAAQAAQTGLRGAGVRARDAHYFACSGAGLAAYAAGSLIEGSARDAAAQAIVHAAEAHRLGAGAAAEGDPAVAVLNRVQADLLRWALS